MDLLDRSRQLVPILILTLAALLTVAVEPKSGSMMPVSGWESPWCKTARRRLMRRREQPPSQRQRQRRFLLTHLPLFRLPLPRKSRLPLRLVFHQPRAAGTGC